MAAIAATIVFLLAEFTKKEVVQGRLVPTLGLVKVGTGVNGTLEELYAKQGDLITKGQTLAVVASDTSQFGGKQAIENQIATAKTSLSELAEQIEREKQQAEIAKVKLKGKSAGLNAELAVQENQKTLLARTIYILTRGVDAPRKLELELQLSSLNRETVSRQVERDQIESDLASLPKILDLTISRLKFQQLEVSQKIAGLQSQLRYEVISPQDGIVDYIAFQQGQTITPSASLLSIVPKNAILEAELFAPVRSITSLKAGQAIRIDYEPFPASRFGFAHGKIKSVNQTVLTPQELTSFGFTSTSPVYRIVASLDRQDFPVDGKGISLRAGIGFSSDVIIERWPLWRWLYQYMTETWNAR